MYAIYGTIQLVLNVVYFTIIIQVIMSWLINFQVLNLGQPLVANIWQGLNKLLEPLYSRLRRILPNTHPLDLAPLVALIAVIALRSFILPDLFGYR